MCFKASNVSLKSIEIIKMVPIFFLSYTVSSNVSCIVNITNRAGSTMKLIELKFQGLLSWRSPRSYFTPHYLNTLSEKGCLENDII